MLAVVGVAGCGGGSAGPGHGVSGAAAPDTPLPPTPTPLIHGAGVVISAHFTGSDVAPPYERLVDVTLVTGGNPIAGVQIDIAYPPTAPVEGRPDGSLACEVNPDIDEPDTVFGLEPNCPEPGYLRVRTLVLNLHNTATLPDGARLFSCAVLAEDGELPVPLVVGWLGLSDPEGRAIDGQISAGSGVALTITTTPAACGPTPLPTATPTPQEFVDQGNGTIFDTRTGLTWEKKSWDGSVHDLNNFYAIVLEPGESGQSASAFLAELNAGSGFAGYMDWRLPTKDELVDLAMKVCGPPCDLEAAPTILPWESGSCTAGCTVLTCDCILNRDYLSSTCETPRSVWAVELLTADAYFYPLETLSPVVAVRGGTGSTELCDPVFPYGP